MGGKNAVGVSIGEIAFRPMSSGFGLFHKGHHLTICLNKASQKLDIHVTRESPYKILVRKEIDLADLERFTMEFGSKVIPSFLSKFRRVKPGWLKRHGYNLMATSEQSFMALMKRHSRLRKRKYRPDLNAAFREMALTPDKWTFSTDILHSEDLKSLQGTIMAQSWQRKCQGKKLFLMNWNGPGKAGWYALSEGQLMGLAETMLPIALHREAKELVDVIGEKVPLETMFTGVHLQ